MNHNFLNSMINFKPRFSESGIFGIWHDYNASQYILCKFVKTMCCRNHKTARNNWSRAELCRYFVFQILSQSLPEKSWSIFQNFDSWKTTFHVILKKKNWHLSIWQNWCFVQFHHSKIEVLPNCSALFCVSLFCERWLERIERKFETQKPGQCQGSMFFDDTFDDEVIP